MKTEVAIIGGGPSGLLLSQLLNRGGIETVILERASREHVLTRIRAGVLEAGSVQMLREAGVADRLDREGTFHHSVNVSSDDQLIKVNFHELTGKRVTVYGQTEVTADLYAGQDAIGTTILHNVDDVVLHDLDQTRSFVEFTHQGARRRLDCKYVAGCDGFHGISRNTIPEEKRRAFERVYPFGWLGVLSRVPPCNDELIYATSSRGFALASMRNENLSRYYIQVPISHTPAQWSDEAFWTELKLRLPSNIANSMETGPSIEKSVAPLRSFVSEPLRWGNLFLVGDAAHIVPPTGAKGLNLAVSDVHYLYPALIDALKNGSTSGIDAYSERALLRIWKAMRFSWQLTTMLHHFEGEDSFAVEMRRATLNHLASSETARRDMSENYVGLPF